MDKHKDQMAMADLIRDVTPGAFAPSQRSRRRDDENGGDDFARWLSGGRSANDREVPRRPLTQRPMTSIEDMLLLARAREEIENASSHPAAYVDAQALESQEDENQYRFDFMGMGAGSQVDKRI